jgi:hypothetical protein
MAKGRAQLVLDNAQMRAVLTGRNSAAVQLVQKAQRQTLTRAKITSPVDSGALRNSHVAEPIKVSGDKVTTEISASGAARQEYAMFVHEGTKPHVIKPRRKKVLSWKGPEGRVFASSVNHPGTPARPWLRDALQSTAPRLGFVVDSNGK